MKKMKRIFNTLICMATALLSFSCQDELNIEMPVNESIILDLSSGGLTKATVADEDHESFINHIDVLIFEVGNDNKPADCRHHEKVTVTDPANVVLAARRTDFDENTRYFVYIVANSSLDLSLINNFSDLNNKMQEDELLHLTGLHLGTGINNPQYFLMDAVATDANNDSPVVLYDGNPADNTLLKAVLRRAAAKVVINIEADDKVTFKNYGVAEGSEGGLYYVRNLPYDTYLLAETKKASEIYNAKLRTTAKTDTEYFSWHPETEPKKVSLVTYVYPHQWKDASILDKETCVVVNLPMEFINGENQTVQYHNSWYKIPMTRTDAPYFERNHCYQVSINLNRPGAISESEPIKIENLHYSVEDWTPINVNVGGGNRPNYLQLNTNHVDMYNVNTDTESLTFASSSEIADIELLEAYYFDYLDTQVNLQNHSKYNVYNLIKATPEAGVLNGKITIDSPFVGKTEAEIQEEVAALGPAPSVTMEEPNPPVNPEKTAPDPQEIVNKYNQGMSNNSRSRITYSGEGANVTFSPASGRSNSTARRNAASAQSEYDAAWDDYAAWGNLTPEQKEAAIAAYNALLNQYNLDKAEYDRQVQALADYNDTVAQIYNTSGSSHSNAIRYLRFRVTNTTGQSAEFTVNQYPTIYITNKRGHYSYRSDFGGTTYNSAGNPNRSGANWSNNNWTYGEGSSGSYFFGSKVALGSEGNYTINYTYWDDDQREVDNISSLNNPRMYHVHVTATSATYTVAVPALDGDGYTASTAENTKLVSPSFMIASQLGATLTPNGGINQAKSHCEQYIEVGTDGTVYDDWRLPTAAEIDIIIQHQDISDAMAVVLTGTAYYCAYNTDNNGNVIYTKATGKNGGQNAVRCIRDAY